ncbi:diacylglycerol/lipid kinase family protein [Rhodococcus rhodochrous]|uniref:NAD(+)/NADH kinase n=1 Tax=Rhodococcus rhodochrous TaxID=1829 RepID=A0AAW4XAI1_RHORH|nr:diacylglycerol kinase family protein [Rhodococcus rhodochrous]MCD2110074.1 NAD(+)/NADH kinase [Rhodococcus rhodochrous]QHG80612.1 diacylglycerol kinase [Rhodococcus rhodochrous]QOH55447.1 diacylglycerol kinase [Rhodococcus rhodochrous]
MAEEHESHRGPVSADARWWAWTAVVVLIVAIVLPVAEAGLRGVLALLLVAVAGAALAVAGAYWFLTHRGVVRAVALTVTVLVPVVVVVVFALSGHLWVAVVSVLLVAVAVACGRRALRGDRVNPQPEFPAVSVHHPFFVMNPRSGGGKVVRYDLQRKAEELGAEVVLLSGPQQLDVTELAEKAVERGADLLGVAGGDGTQALVAAVAAEHRLPFVVISAGTRNHFALDLGLDREDPAAGLDALRDGVELRVDLGRINERPFVNNASFGVYAEVVRSPQYRADKTATVLQMLPDLLGEQGRPGLRAHIDTETVEGPQAVLVSNGPYAFDDLAGMGRRPRLDSGRLGVVAISVSNARQAVGLFRRTHNRGLLQRTATEVVVDADVPEIPVGVDGESVMLSTPVRCTISTGALRVRVPRNRPGARVPPPHLDSVRLRKILWPN